MAYTVEVRDLRKAYGSHVVLDGIDLRVEDGTVYGLLGSNGAGKTTLVSILSTLLRPDGGTATVAGCDVVADPDGVRRAISLTGQHVSLDEVLTVRENLELVAELRRLGRRGARSRVEELLVQFDLIDVAEKRIADCSGGTQRRVDVAASLVRRPQLLFLDEPTTGLDPRSREQLWATIRRVVAEGTTVLLTTQYLEEADRLADRIAVLHLGHVVAEGTAAELKAGHGTGGTLDDVFFALTEVA